jgi:predicted ATPase
MRKYAQINRDDRTAQFATELASALHEMRLTHKKLAEALGVTLATVDSWCRITHPVLPSEHNLRKLCAWLDERKPGAGARLLAITGIVTQPTQLTQPNQPPAQHLRPPPTSFVGRTQALQNITDHFVASGQRLLSLIGPGGIGKTRLAAQAIPELVAEFEGGIWWVSLENVSGSDAAAYIWRAIATALSLQEAGGRTMAEQVTARLHRAHALLVLDNCEQAAAACAAVASRLLRECPSLAILATSREPLQLNQEAIYSVPTLSLPPSPKPRRAQLTRFEATRLFVERAMFAQHGLLITEDDAAHIAHICRHLDGLALAIELAAGCLPQLNVAQVAQGLQDRFALLTRGSSLAPERHQTLRATIAWSHDLLSAEERGVFAKLAVFAGITHLGAVSVTQLVEMHCIASLQTLARKSLVVIEERHQHVRYRMLESIREFAREQLAAREDAYEIHQRHAKYFAQLAEQGGRELNGPKQGEWLSTLDAEQDNFRAALQWARQHDANLGVRLCAALWPFWLVRGYLSEGRDWVDWALRAANDATEELHAALWHGAGALARQQVDYARARQGYTEAIRLYRQRNQPLAMAQALNEMGIVATAQSQPDQAQALYQESLNLSDQFDDGRTAAAAMFGLGLLAYERGPNAPNAFALAQNYLQASAQAAKECGDDVILLRALNGLGELARAQNKMDVAQTHYQESLRLSQQLGHKWGQAAALHNLGYVRKSQGDVVASLAHFRESLNLYRALDEERGLAECLVGIASVLAERDETARQLLAAAHTILQKLGARLTATEQVEFEHAADRVGLAQHPRPSERPYAELIERSIEIANNC